jgi:integrase
MKATGRSVWQNQKTGKWVYQVRVPQLGNSALVRQRTANSKVEAMEAADKLYEELKGKASNPNPKFFAELFANYLELRRPFVKPQTLANNRYLIEKYVLPAFGSRLVANIQPAEIQHFLLGLRPALATATVNKLRTIMNSVFSVGVDYRYIPFNPMAPVKPLPKLPGETTQVQQAWSVEEARCALKAFEGTLLDFFVVAATSLGLRKGEIMGLRWGDLDFERGFIDIQNNRGSRRTTDSEGKIRTCMVEGELKTIASRRRIPLTSLALLSLMRERERANHLGFPCDKDSYVVRGVTGKPIAEATLYRHYNRISEANGLRRIRVHDNRHTAAVIALQAEVDITPVSYGLGHSSIEVTKRIYAPRVPALAEKFALGLANALEDQSERPRAKLGVG